MHRFERKKEPRIFVKTMWLAALLFLLAAHAVSAFTLSRTHMRRSSRLFEQPNKTMFVSIGVLKKRNGPFGFFSREPSVHTTLALIQLLSHGGDN